MIPLENPKPDAEEFVDILMGRRSGRVPLVEYIVDDAVMRPIVVDLLGRRWVQPSGDRESLRAYLDNLIEFWYRMGYDCIKFEIGMPFAENKLFAPDTAFGSRGMRAWADEHRGTIGSWEDFERYRWPRVEDLDLFPIEYIDGHLPDGMGLLLSHSGGVFEHMSWIMSLEGLCFLLYDDPDLVEAVANRIGELMIGFYRNLFDFEKLVAIFPGDDMGFRTGTLISPESLRRYVLPWHKKIAAMAHERDVPYFLHSCGNIEPIMEDLIKEVGIDGKHSFEDAIMPVEDFQARYGDRIAVLGVVDLNILGAGSPDDVRRGTREICGRIGELHPKLCPCRELPGHGGRGRGMKRVTPFIGHPPS